MYDNEGVKGIDVNLRPFLNSVALPPGNSPKFSLNR
jgi:hypothetical protein